MNAKQKRGISFIVMLVLLVGILSAGVVSAQSGTNVNVTITASEFKFEPAQLNVPLNTPVSFTVTNTGNAPHNVTFELASANVEQNLFAENVQPGETRTGTFTFTQAGDWEMYCPVGQHAERGMTGTVMVAAAQAATPGTAPAATPATLPTTGEPVAMVSMIVALFGVAVLGLAVALRFSRSQSRL